MLLKPGPLRDSPGLWSAPCAPPQDVFPFLLHLDMELLYWAFHPEAEEHFRNMHSPEEFKRVQWKRIHLGAALLQPAFQQHAGFSWLDKIRAGGKLECDGACATRRDPFPARRMPPMPEWAKPENYHWLTLIGIRRGWDGLLPSHAKKRACLGPA